MLYLIAFVGAELMVIHVNEAWGIGIHLKDQAFTVGVACSGINILVSLLALACIYAYLLKGWAYRRAFIFLLGVPIAIGVSMLRDCLIIIFANYYETDPVMTCYDWSDPLFFITAFLLLILIVKILRRTARSACFEQTGGNLIMSVWKGSFQGSCRFATRIY